MYQIVICDDCQDELDTLKEFVKNFFTERGLAHNVVEYTSPAVLLRDLKNGVFFDLFFLDIMMPGIDGLETTRRIRALDREDAATTPIIAVSANAFADDRRLSREAGMDAHLSKPVNSQELVEALAHIAADAS